MSGPRRDRMGPAEIAWTVLWLLLALGAFWVATGQPPWPTELR